MNESEVNGNKNCFSEKNQKSSIIIPWVMKRKILSLASNECRYVVMDSSLGVCLARTNGFLVY